MFIYILYSVSDSDPGGSEIFSSLGSGFGKKSQIRIQASQICQNLFIFEQNFDEYSGGNAIFSLDVQRFECLRRFLQGKANPQNFSFRKKAKKFRNFEYLSRFGQDPDPESDPDS